MLVLKKGISINSYTCNKVIKKTVREEIMNILFVGHEDKMNGASRCMIEIIDEMILRGHSIYVLTSYEEGDFYDELRKREVGIVYYNFHRWIVSRPQSDFRWLLRKNKARLLLEKDRLGLENLCEQIKKYNIDVIHSNTSVICLGAWIAEKLRIKHVWHLREFGKEDFHMYPVLKEKTTWKYISENADCCIAISNAIEKKYRPLIGSEHIKRIYDGVLIPKNVKKRVFSSQNVNLMIAGRIGDAKGQREAVQAIIELKRRGYNCFHLYILGNGNIENLKYIDGFESVSDKISFCGFNSDLDSFRENIDVELVCSRAEGFGRVTVEAMMMGNPVIGANTGATVELIKNGQNGYLYNKGNISDLADKIVLLTQGTSKYNQISDFAYEFARKNFSIKRNVDDILKLYELLNVSEKSGDK